MDSKIYTYKNYLVDKYKEKTYKLPINIPTTCPNRDPVKGGGGCHFCSAQGTGFKYSPPDVPVVTQLQNSKERVIRRYNARKFIAYFQNYTATYLPLELLRQYLEQVAEQDLVAVHLSARPDRLAPAYLDMLRQYADKYRLDIGLDIGLQIANDQVLTDINRQHTVKDYIDCVKQVKDYGFEVCSHVILNLPDTQLDDVKQTALLLNQVKTDVVKVHSLYITADSVFGQRYQAGQLEVGTAEQYVERVLSFIGWLEPTIAISRLVSRVPEDKGLFANWGMSWWKIYNQINQSLEQRQIKQGLFLE